MTADSWEIIRASTLAKSWIKLLGEDMINMASISDSPRPSQDCEELLKELDGSLSDSDISAWMNADSDNPGYQLFSDEEIIHQVTCLPETTCNNDEENSDSSTPLSPPMPTIVVKFVK